MIIVSLKEGVNNIRLAEDVYASPTHAILPYVVTQDYSIYATVSLNYNNYNISSNVVFQKLGPILFTEDWVSWEILV